MKLAFSPAGDGKKQPYVVDVPDNPRVESEILIGRAANCDIQIPQRFVSRRHCGIRVDTTTRSIQVHDFGSANGTFVNDQPVEGLCDVVDGDTLTIGPVSLTVQIVRPTAY